MRCSISQDTKDVHQDQSILADISEFPTPDLQPSRSECRKQRKQLQQESNYNICRIIFK